MARRRNYRRNPSTTTWLLLGGVVLGGGVAYYLYSQSKAAGGAPAGGRIIAPLGDQYPTGAGPFGLLVGPSARTVVTSNSGPGPNSLTVLARGRAFRSTTAPLLRLRRPTRAAA